MNRSEYSKPIGAILFIVKYDASHQIYHLLA